MKKIYNIYRELHDDGECYEQDLVSVVALDTDEFITVATEMGEIAFTGNNNSRLNIYPANSMKYITVMDLINQEKYSINWNKNR